MLNLQETFEKYSDDEFIKFERVENKFSKRSDLHAFILLDKILPGESDIVEAAEHDEIYLGVDEEELAKVITEEQVLELVRSGVSYGEYGLYMIR